MISPRLPMMVLAALLVACTANHTARVKPNPTPRDTLWQLVHGPCTAAAEKDTFAPLPCTEVVLARGAQDGYAVLKDRSGRFQYLVLPLAHVTGIESPALLAANAANYFADAWNARLYVEAALHERLPREDVVLIVNSPHGRSQDQLHIHVGCIRPDVRDALHTLLPTLDEQWRPLASPLPPHARPYWARWVAGEALSINPIQSLAASLRADDHLARHSLAMTGAHDKDGKPGFILLSTQANPELGDDGNSDELHDLTCAIASNAPQ